MVTGALGTQIFGFKNGLIFYRSMAMFEVEFPEVLWPYIIVSVAESGNMVCDP